MATVVQLNAESPDDAGPDSLWVLGDAQGHILGTYAMTPYKPEPHDPSISMGRFVLRHIAAGIVLGSLVVVVTDLL